MIEPSFKAMTKSADETFELARWFGQQLTAPCVIAFCGGLGAGKTTFIRGIASCFEIDEREICSPTFTYLNIYEGSVKMYHFDLYRIPSEKEFVAAGFDEFLDDSGICCIEWSEKIPSLLPKNIERVSIVMIKENHREICIERLTASNLSGLSDRK